jgi:hypothetical protein
MKRDFANLPTGPGIYVLRGNQRWIKIAPEGQIGENQ